jgi:hypothetical protein
MKRYLKALGMSVLCCFICMAFLGLVPVWEVLCDYWFGHSAKGAAAAFAPVLILLIFGGVLVFLDPKGGR